MGSPRNGFMKDLYILSVDVGTTSIRGHVYDKEANIKGSSSEKISLLYPNPGWVELDPEALWLQFVTVAKAAVQAAGLQMKQITALGISTQRATFTTWSRKTGKPFHNFISWQDRRASELVTSWNNSFTMKALHGSSKVLHFITRRKQFLAASIITFSTQHVTFRLAWVLQNLKKVQEAVEEGNCCFGTIDTWLLYRLTKGAVHATDYSSASATGIFDSYQMCWSGMLCSLISLPLSIFPTVENTCHKFGSTDTSIFGVPIPIMSLVADQQAAMFGECCFDTGDVKITMGTGTFININTGNKPHTSISGLYPVVGWKIGQEVVYLAEGNAADTGTAIKWAQELDLFSDAAETEAMANSVPDADGVCFVPSFSGLQAPLNDPHACASFMGLKPSTTKSHLVRAILESIAFRNKQLYEIMSEETQIPVTNIRADGGVCNNSFVMQLTADLFNRKINRPRHFDMSSLGAAFIAGLGIGFWSSKEELKCLGCTEKVFYPQNVWKNYSPVIDRWEKALTRSMHWYSKP
ncbi:putative glycerol kinase 5 isoform X1 [Acipenser oxyrinchus oxyrinchus]|uniref:Glycerol kinase 5 n=1 Tax=Acipenser oxyrinchus oxyrinchus TaxID=40147 RepID=A0AAD8D4T9_ACIOX|nr:putative glycerol kinase 5 isoform X1 [Acipenser oxyrinchus oxyrinchus]